MVLDLVHQWMLKVSGERNGTVARAKGVPIGPVPSIGEWFLPDIARVTSPIKTYFSCLGKA